MPGAPEALVCASGSSSASSCPRICTSTSYAWLSLRESHLPVVHGGQSVRAALSQEWLPWDMRLWWGCHFQRWQMAGCADAGMFFAICWV